MIPIKTEDEIKQMQEGGEKLAEVMRGVLKQVRPGVKLSELDKLAEVLIEKQGGESSFKMVPSYHWATCINVNEGVVHGVPHKYRIKNGDVVSVDMGMFFKGLHTDMARTLRVRVQRAKLKVQSDEFLEAGRRALKKAIEAARLGNRVGHISQAIEQEIKKAGFSPIQSLTGHGVGKELHEGPQIPCFLRGDIEKTTKLKPGMTLAIEVIYSQGKPEVVLNDDNWTINTEDGSLAGLFEDTIAVTTGELLVLTSAG